MGCGFVFGCLGLWWFVGWFFVVGGLGWGEDFMDNLSQAAQFAFQDGLTEAFYEKNPQVYENAFALFEAAQMEGGDANIAAAFHEEYQRLYHDFLLELFDAQYAE